MRSNNDAIANIIEAEYIISGLPINMFKNDYYVYYDPKEDILTPKEINITPI